MTVENVKRDSSEPPSEDFSAAIIDVLKEVNETFEENVTPIFIHPEIASKKIVNATREFRIPNSERILGLIDWTTFGSGKKGMAFCEQGVYGLSPYGDSGDDQRFSFTYQQLAGVGKIEYYNEPRVVSLLNNSLSDSQPPISHQVDQVLLRLQPACLEIYPKALSEQFEKDAATLIAENDWNELYEFTKKWAVNEPKSKIRTSLNHATCLFTKPPLLEELNSIGISPEVDNEQFRSWLLALPDGQCRNIIYALALSHTELEASEKMLVDELEKRPSAEAALALGLLSDNRDLSLKYFDQAIELDGTNALALYKRGSIARKLNDLENAKDLLIKAIKYHNGLLEAHSELASLYEEEQNTKLWKKQLKKIVAMDPNGRHGKDAADLLGLKLNSSSSTSASNPGGVGVDNTLLDALKGLAVIVFICLVFIFKGPSDYDSFLSGIVAPVKVVGLGIVSLLSSLGDQQTIALEHSLDATWRSGSTMYKVGFAFGVILIVSAIRYIATLLAVIRSILD